MSLLGKLPFIYFFYSYNDFRATRFSIVGTNFEKNITKHLFYK